MRTAIRAGLKSAPASTRGPAWDLLVADLACLGLVPEDVPDWPPISAGAIDAFAGLSGTGHGCGIADLQRKHPGAHGARVDWVTQTAESSDRRKKEKAAQDLARGANPERHATRATAPHGTTCRIGRQPDHQPPLWTALGFRPPDLFRFSLSDLHHARCCCALHYLPSLPRFPLPGCHPRLLKVQRFPSYSIATANLHAAALQDEPSHTLTPDR